MSWGIHGGLGLGAHIPLSNPADQHVRRAFVEKAVSGASSCRTCKKKIGQGRLRVQYSGGKFVHLSCWKGPSAIVPDNYFVSHSLLKPEDEQRLEEWIVKHNTAQKAKEQPVPSSPVRTFSVSSVRANPQTDEGAASGIDLLTKDTMSLILQFLNVRELCLIERVSKAFLRACGFEWQRRLEQTGGKAVSGQAKQAYLTGVCAGCNKHVENGTFLKSLNRSVCRACAASSKSFSFVAKKYLKDYGLTEKDIKTFKIPSEKRPNPYGAALAPMTVFLVYDLERAAAKKAESKPSANKKAKK